MIYSDYWFKCILSVGSLFMLSCINPNDYMMIRFIFGNWCRVWSNWKGAKAWLPLASSLAWPPSLVSILTYISVSLLLSLSLFRKFAPCQCLFDFLFLACWFVQSKGAVLPQIPSSSNNRPRWGLRVGQCPWPSHLLLPLFATTFNQVDREKCREK